MKYGKFQFLFTFAEKRTPTLPFSTFNFIFIEKCETM